MDKISRAASNLNHSMILCLCNSTWHNSSTHLWRKTISKIQHCSLLIVMINYFHGSHCHNKVCMFSDSAFSHNLTHYNTIIITGSAAVIRSKKHFGCRLPNFQEVPVQICTLHLVPVCVMGRTSISYLNSHLLFQENSNPTALETLLFRFRLKIF